MRRATIVAGCVLLALGLALVGCGGKNNKKNGIASAQNGKGTSASPTPSVDPYQQALKFAQCMRSHGVQMEDPKPGEGGGLRVTVPGGSGGGGTAKLDPKLSAATKACQAYLPNGGAAPTLSPEELDQARRWVACLRQHGLDVADPTANQPGPQIQKNATNTDAKVKAAMAACQSLEFKPKMFSAGPGQ